MLLSELFLRLLQTFSKCGLLLARAGKGRFQPGCLLLQVGVHSALLFRLYGLLLVHHQLCDSLLRCGLLALEHLMQTLSEGFRLCLRRFLALHRGRCHYFGLVLGSA
jgi:hypothetical protein